MPPEAGDSRPAKRGGMGVGAKVVGLLQAPTISTAPLPAEVDSDCYPFPFERTRPQGYCTRSSTPPVDKLTAVASQEEEETSMALHHLLRRYGSSSNSSRTTRSRMALHLLLRCYCCQLLDRWRRLRRSVVVLKRETDSRRGLQSEADAFVGCAGPLRRRGHHSMQLSDVRHLGNLRLANRISVRRKYDVDAPLMDHLNPNPIRLFPAQSGAIGRSHVCTLGLEHRVISVNQRIRVETQRMWESICLTLMATAGNNIGKVLQKKGTVILPPLSFKLKVSMLYSPYIRLVCKPYNRIQFSVQCYSRHVMLLELSIDWFDVCIFGESLRDPKCNSSDLFDPLYALLDTWLRIYKRRRQDQELMHSEVIEEIIFGLESGILFG
ncbi:hypothetical protein BHE74_00007009 [Ensete ventricosum]|nr:hypothetical protein BHE74_00007009 [Ensete ventricosum]